jgi:hypothetical protein
LKFWKWGLSLSQFDAVKSQPIDISYTLDSASKYSAIQKLKPWLQTQDIPMKWEDSYVFKWHLFMQMGVTAEIFLASNLLKEMRYLVEIRYLCSHPIYMLAST